MGPVNQTDSKDGNKAPFESVSDLVNTALQYYKNRKEFEVSMQETILTFMKSNPAVKKELERLMREIISRKISIISFFKNSENSSLLIKY